MKKILFITVLIILSTLSAKAQKIYSVDAEYKAGENDGKWFFVDAEYKAKKKIFFVDAEYKAELKVYFVDAEYKAGWKKSEKKHLMY